MVVLGAALYVDMGGVDRRRETQNERWVGSVFCGILRFLMRISVRIPAYFRALK